MKKILINILSSFVIFSCQGQGKNNAENKTQKIEKIQQSMEEKIDLEQTAKHLKLQENAMPCGDVYDGYEPLYEPTKKDFDLMLPLLEKSLINSGYKAPDYSIFKQKIQEGFGIDIDKGKENIIILFHKEYQYPFYGNLNDDLYNHCASNLFIDKQRRIITPMILLSDLIEINNRKTEDYSIKQNLTILSLNKYLFYEDKASLTYLLSREIRFIRNLLSSFGYDKEEKINQSVLDYNYSRLRDEYKLGELVFVKNKKGEMQIREGVLNTIANNTSENNNDWLYALNKFGYRIYSNDYTEEYEYRNQFTLEEKRKIVAYILNTYAPLYHKYILKHEGKAHWDPGSILVNLCAEDNELKDHIISQNYYGLPNLKEELAMTPCPWEPADP